MLLESYNGKGLLTITSVLGATTEKDKFAFRGDLVIKEGELREGSDRDRKPPAFFVHQAVILASQDKFLFVGGLIHELDKLVLFVEKYKEALSPETLFILYVENIEEMLKVDYAGYTFQLLPYGDSLIWNDLLELLYIEKSDLKGQSAEDKVITAFEAAKSFDTKTPIISFDDALKKTVIVTKDLSVGAV